MSITMATILALLFMPFSILVLIGVAICILMANYLPLSTILMVLLIGWIKYNMVKDDYSNRRPAVIITVHLFIISLSLYISVFFIMVPSLVGRDLDEGIKTLLMLLLYWFVIGLPILVNCQCKFQDVVYNITKYRQQNKKEVAIWIICLVLNFISIIYMIFKMIPDVGYNAFEITYNIATLDIMKPVILESLNYKVYMLLSLVA